jgi:dTDP-4-amino-4,6-dideoxygalactose transaminase
MGQAELDQVNQVLLSGMLTTGPKVTEFEEAVRAFLGCRAAVGLVSCTGGLHTALHALGVGPGDEVIVPTMTFTATAHVVQWLGARPVWPTWTATTFASPWSASSPWSQNGPRR